MTTLAPTATISPPPSATATAMEAQTEAPTPLASIRPVLSGDTLTVPLAEGEVLLDFAVSPDRRAVAYMIGTSSALVSRLYSVPLNGGAPSLLSEAASADSSTRGRQDGLHWLQITPDSGSVLFQSGGALLQVPIGGGPQRQIATGLGAKGLPGPMLPGASGFSGLNMTPDFTLSPAGDAVVYRQPDAILVLPLAGGPPRRLSGPPPPGSYLYGFQLSPDGRWLVYDLRYLDLWDQPQTPSYGAGLVKITAVYSVPIEGGRPILLASAPTEDGGIDEDYALSPGSAELRYRTYTTDGEVEPAVWQSWSVPLAGGAPTKVGP
jgi:hypothetical protein